MKHKKIAPKKTKLEKLREEKKKLKDLPNTDEESPRVKTVEKKIDAITDKNKDEKGIKVKKGKHGKGGKRPKKAWSNVTCSVLARLETARAKRPKVEVEDCVFYSVDQRTDIGKANFESAPGNYLLLGKHPKFPNVCFGVSPIVEKDLKIDIQAFQCDANLQKPFKTTKAELTLFVLVNAFLNTNNENICKLIGKKLLKLDIPEHFQFKKTAGTTNLYRGVELSEKAVEKLKEDKPVKIKAVPVSVWSTNFNVVSSDNLALKLPIEQADVLLSVTALCKAFRSVDDRKRVLLIGSGMPSNTVNTDNVILV